MLSVDPQTGTLSDSAAAAGAHLAIGCLVGELLRIDDHLNFGKMIRNRLGAAACQGFVTASRSLPLGP